MIKWLDAAVTDLKALREYIALDKPPVANEVAKRIVSAVNQLDKHPEIGRPGRVHNTRELVVSGTPYIVPYRVHHQFVEILRVFHGAMQWPEEF